MALTYDVATDSVSGVFAADARGECVSISCDGSHWATVRAFAIPDRPGAVSFACSLAPVAMTTRAHVTARLAGVAEAELAIDIVREPLRNRHGLLAADVFAIDHQPFLAMPWLSFDGARMTLGGMHLPPEGDPAKLSIEFGPGVSYAVDFGTASPDFRNHYWYWPNAQQCALSVSVDLAASKRTSNPFHFRCTYPEASGLGGGKRPVDIWLPRSFTAFRGFPTDATQMTRVQTFSTSATVAITGYNAFKTIEELFARTGIDRLSRPTILDWGCGHGRVTCHFIDAWPEARIFGTDIDAENIAWCRDNLEPGTFFTAPLWPPCPLDDGSIDGVFGISVMTHLTADAQAAWFRELARLLRPGGTALVTFQAEAGAAFASFWRDPEWWQGWLAHPFDDDQRDHVLAGKIDDPDYYRNTTQSTQSIVRASDPYFELIAIEPAIFGGYQDCAILKRR